MAALAGDRRAEAIGHSGCAREHKNEIGGRTLNNQWFTGRAGGSLVALAMAAVAFALPARAQQTPPYKCQVHPDVAKLDLPLARTGRRIHAGQPLKIVAIGSSSTQGVGASSAAATYPARLEAELKRLFPANGVMVVNHGVGGEEARDMLRRLDGHVFAEKPDLVLWQVGTNAVLRDSPLPPAERQIGEGVRRMKQAGMDVVLIDPQFAPRVISMPETPAMVKLLAHAAKEYNVDIFRRYELMRRWVEDEGIPFTTFISPDRLHMNDWSYACVAKVLGVAIAGAVDRPIASAANQRPTSARLAP
jgi:lysophospholipase L1-like esterase